MTDWQLSQGTVDFRNEERKPANRTEQIQPTLFPTPTRCPVKGCHAGDRKSLCAFDADVAHGLREATALRPVACLNTHPQPDATIPY